MSNGRLQILMLITYFSNLYTCESLFCSLIFDNDERPANFINAKHTQNEEQFEEKDNKVGSVQQ